MPLYSQPESKEAKFDPYLTMNNSPTPVKSKVKVLGVILDIMLIIGEYIRSTPEKLPKSNNILKKIVGNDWGCSDEKLYDLQSYRSERLELRCSHLSVRKKQYKWNHLQTQHNTALRTIIRCEKMSDINDLHNEEE